MPPGGNCIQHLWHPRPVTADVGCVLSVQKMSPGDGYRYFERQITSGDQTRPHGCAMSDLQQRAGLPPGVWVGRASALLGVNGEVTEAQLRALFGEGLHPRAEEITAEALRAGARAKAAVAAAKLGTAFYRFGLDSSPAGALAGGEPVPGEGRGGRSDGAGHRGRVAPARQSTAAFHAVLQPPPSITLLWALGEDGVRQVVEDAHDAAVAVTVRWIEDHALATRRGHNGLVQERVTTGLVGAQFRHFDSRAGDAGLHDHVLIANKVRCADGKWLSIDGSHLLPQVVCASEVYNAEVVHRVCVGLGVAVRARPRSDGRRPVMEIAGIDERLLAASPARTAAIRRRLPALLDAYRAKHGREPSQATRVRLLQRATLETRPAKKQAGPLPTLRARWRAQAIARFGRRAVDGMLAAAQDAARTFAALGRRTDRVDVRAVARAAVDTVSMHRAVFGRRHILAEVYRQITYASSGLVDPSYWAERVTRFALDELCLDLTTPDLNPSFAPLQRADGTSVFHDLGSRLFTTPALLAAEDAIVAAARTKLAPACSTTVFNHHRRRFTGQLDAGQVDLARAFATGRRQVIAAIGPAGAGKTAALTLAVQTLTSSKRRVIALAPSARAAQVLGEAIGHSADTIHRWLRQQQPGTRAPARTGAAAPLRRGDTVIIDEAGMAATAHLAEIVTLARKAGAHVRLIGDPSQLAAVEAGGILRLLQTEAGAVHLTKVHRFRTPGEADASLKLRAGTPAEAFTWYRQQNRIHAGTEDAMLDAAFAAWRGDIDAGRSSVMAAPTRVLVGALNLRAQNALLAAGRLDANGRSVALHDGSKALVGDTVVTRRNERRLLCLGGRDFVKNGDTWRIERFTRSGGAVVRHTRHRGRLTLPPAYLAGDTELGYAATIHRTQGMTVDTTHAVLTSRATREAAYVGATRGRLSNRLYIGLGDNEGLDTALLRIATNSDHVPGARETIRSQQGSQGIEQLAAQYAYVAERATELRHRRALHTVLGHDTAAALGPAFTAVTQALTRAEQAGLTAWEVLALAHHTAPDATTTALAQRIDHLTSSADPAHPQGPWTAARSGLLTHLARRYPAAALTALRDAEEHLDALPAPILARGRAHPAWPHRPYGHLTEPQLRAALDRQARTERATSSVTARRYAARAVQDALDHELRLRSTMTRRDVALEDRQRRADASAITPPSAALRHALRAAARDRVTAARLAWRQAVEFSSRTAAAARRRPPGVTDVPRWLAPADAINDPFTPPDWRLHLCQRRDVIDHHLRRRGAELAANPPSWTHPLGPPPDRKDTPARRADWERTAALTEAWRTLHHQPEATLGIGHRPPPTTDPRAWEELKARIDRLTRHNPAPDKSPAGNSGSISERRQTGTPANRSSNVAEQPALPRYPGGRRDWMSVIPSPAHDDPEQQHFHQRLVTACARWRLEHNITGPDPLGPEPHDTSQPQWQHLSTALNEYTNSRFRERLAALASKRVTGHKPLAPVVGEQRRSPRNSPRRDTPARRLPGNPHGPRPI
ncbi:MobF family relaxase [Kitasatospora sp. NPDC057015]|uniref:MobF family relaxase n=1 Tax=Kitasatospora sp. NPDC057015 TaxID=3346001 RepID=UPI00363398D7